ncbi:MAG: Nif3-like dinuclear metal center hexameric protein [Candidatus Sumerlaeaceae bacterium]|jgi:dinuclear metal center YbgI/SA1388 family protein
MALRVQDVVAALDRVAPFRLAYDWDNVGLQIGDSKQKVEAIAVGLEVTSEFLKFAQRHCCQMLLVHHPLIFSPLKRLVQGTHAVDLAVNIIRLEMALAVAHTNLDRVAWGTNGILADLLGLENRRPVEPTSLEEQFKFTVFVPINHVSPLIEAIHRGGGGWIGKYSHCTFRASGTGTYLPEVGANPYQGSVGKLEEAEEVRLEAIVPKRSLGAVIHEVLAVHPYEEVAYDVYPLVETNPRAGLGVIGTLPKALTLGELAKKVAKVCDANCTTLAGDRKIKVERIAIVTGSAGSTVDTITRDVADVVVTGELGYHKACELVERGVALVCAGHAATEKIVAPALAKLVANELGSRGEALRWHVFQDYADPCEPL